MPLAPAQLAALAELPIRPITMRAWRHTPPRREPLDLLPQARQAGRWHEVGDPAPCYAASSQMAAMLEQTRTDIVEPGEEPPLPVRLLSELRVRELPTIDLATAAALERLGLSAEDLTRGYDAGRGSEICRALAAAVRRRPGARALLAPSAALRGAHVLVAFPEGLAHINVGEQTIVQLAISPAAGP